MKPESRKIGKRRRKDGRKRAVLAGIAGSSNAFSLSLYNLKSAACADPELRRAWEFPVIQHPLINPPQRESKTPALLDRIVALSPDLVGLSCYMWNLDVFRDLARGLVDALPDCRILLGGPEMSRDYIVDGKYDGFSAHFCISGEGEQASPSSCCSCPC